MAYLHMRINELMEERGISKNKVCRALNIPRANFNRYCRDEFQRIDANLIDRPKTGPVGEAAGRADSPGFRGGEEPPVQEHLKPPVSGQAGSSDDRSSAFSTAHPPFCGCGPWATSYFPGQS